MVVDSLMGGDGRCATRGLESKRQMWNGVGDLLLCPTSSQGLLELGHQVFKLLLCCCLARPGFDDCVNVKNKFLHTSCRPLKGFALAA